MRQKIRIGCDPGAKGGIFAIYEDGTLKLHKTPVVKKEIDINQFKNILLDFAGDVNSEGNWVNDVLVLVEDVHSLHLSSAASNFSFGRALGILEGIVSALDIPFVKIQPKEWQATMFKGIPVFTKAGKPKLDKKTKALIPTVKTDTKAMALLAAKRIFPNTSFVAPGCKVDHDGMIDAALMAKYLTIKF